MFPYMKSGMALTHKAPQYIKEAVYGLCEINREKTKGARLVANPGCYTTCSILTAYPLVKGRTDRSADTDHRCKDAVRRGQAEVQR